MTWARRAYAALAGGGVLLVVIAAVALLDPLSRNNDKGTYAPLYGYDVQRVGGDKVFTTGETVPVSAQKCAEGNAPVTVIGSLAWRRVSPPGEAVQLGTGVVERGPGCEQFQFANRVPERVAKITRDLGVPVQWQITGTETPEPIDERRPVPITFQSEVFTILPE